MRKSAKGFVDCSTINYGVNTRKKKWRTLTKSLQKVDELTNSRKSYHRITRTNQIKNYKKIFKETKYEHKCENPF